MVLPAIRLPLTQGKFAIVNECDAGKVLGFSWFAIAVKGIYWYAATTIRSAGPRRQELIFMHRLIISTDNFVDHKNHDGLDNRRSNLRAANNRQNQANQTLRSGQKFKGIYRKVNRWVPSIRLNGKKTKLGSFKSPEHAARIYDQAARIQWGEYAFTNFP